MNKAYGQLKIPASSPEFSATPWTVDPTGGNDAWLNCDMLEYNYRDDQSQQNFSGRLTAIVYGRHCWSTLGVPTESHVWVDDGINQISIPLPDSAADADMALAEFVNGSIVTYYVCVVYDSIPFLWSPINPSIPDYQYRTPFFVVYQLTGVGTGTLGYTLPGILPGTSLQPNPMKLSTNDSSGAGIHIDMFTDMANPNPYSGLPSTHYYGITWADGRARELYYMHADLDPSSLTSPYPIPTGITGVDMPDVAAVTETKPGGSIEQELEIVYPQYPNLYVYEINLTTLASSFIQKLEDSVYAFAPRIEAMSQYDAMASPLPLKWQVNAIIGWNRQYYGSTSGTPYPVPQLPPCGRPTVWHAAGYNNNTIPVTPSFSPNPCTGPAPYPMGTSQLDISAPIFFSEDIKAPCVAAGVSPAFNSNIGNQQYTVGFFPWQSHTSNYYERNINPFTGLFISPDAFEVSTTPVDYTWDVAQSFAISNSSNSGADIWSAWYSGTDIMYKLSTPNVMAFRPTALQTGTIKNPFGQHIYPNPVNSNLQIDGAMGSEYRISDITGRQMTKGSLGSSNTVDVHNYAPGTYLLWLKDATGKEKTTKFTKN